MNLDDLYGITFPALRIETPETTDTDRARLIRRIKGRRNGYRAASVLPYAHAAFDLRWIYLDATSFPLQSERRAYLEHVAAGTDWIGVGSGAPLPLVTRSSAAGPARMIPMHAVSSEWSDAQRRYLITKSPNLTRTARQYILRHGLGEDDLFHHVVAMLAARRDTSRFPLPEDRSKVRMSALLGYRVARLYTNDDSIIARPHDQELRSIGIPTRIGKEARMLRGSVLLVDDLWREGERVEARAYADDELLSLGEHAAATGMSTDEMLALIGRETCDVYLNEKAYWKNVPRAVWEEGSLRAWLRDRCGGDLERPLGRDEAMHFASAARRIAALLVLQPALQRNAELLDEARRPMQPPPRTSWSTEVRP